MKEFWDKVVNFFSTAGWTVVTFLAVLAGGIIIIRLLVYFLRRILVKSPLDNTLANFILTFIKFMLYMILLFILANVAHIPLTPLVTALGAVALAIGLALKDSLSNLANGVVILGTKPFKEGDFVDIGSISGTVKSIKMLTTELITTDNKKITVPNSKITSECVVNYSAKPTRRIEWKFGVSYESDLKQVRQTINEVISRHPAILHMPEPTVRLSEQADSALVFLVRVWVNNPDYWPTFFDVNEQVFEAFKAAGIEVPYNQLDVHLKPEKEEDKQ